MVCFVFWYILLLFVSFSEYKYFNYSNPEWTEDNGHFLERVWPETKHIGVGIAYSDQNVAENYIVARYLSGVQSERIHIVKKPESMSSPDSLHDVRTTNGCMFVVHVVLSF